MSTLHPVSIYLLEHWDTYEQMSAVEAEINEQYICPLVEKMKRQLQNHANMPSDWTIETYHDDEWCELYAYPNVWANWIEKDQYLGAVCFGPLTVSNLMSSDEEDRSKFLLENSLAGRQDKISKADSVKLWEASNDYVNQLDGFAWQPSYSKKEGFYRYIDKLGVSVLQDEVQLIKLAVDGMIPIITVVNTMKNDLFPRPPG